ncbi:MAG TPA: PAS domain S-box protein, partial [Rubrobacteraceae bacterium]|nr:PAS domain S-box protein [Rubrobacteraceae bacterium]
MTFIDDRKETGKTSAEREEPERLLAENSTDMISKHTPEGVYTHASPACRNLLGYEPEELLGRSVYEFFHPEDLKRVSNAHSWEQERTDIYTVSYRIRRKNGTYICLETTSSTVRDPETSKVLEIIAVSRDATERKRIDEALRKSEEFNRFAVQAGRIGTWDLDLQTEECLISPKMAELMDFSADQTTVPGARWREAVLPEDRDSMASALAGSIESDAPFDLEFRIARKDGRERWLYSRGGVSRDASGKALRVHGASIDVTERKRAEEKLRKSEERLRRTIEIETVGVIFFRVDGSITEANDTFLRMSGYSRADLVEGLVRWDEMTPPEWMSHALKAIEEFESTGRTMPYEKEYVRKDGSRWWGLFAATRLDEDEGVEFIIDITKSKWAEEELQESNERITNILESITDAFFSLDREWRFVYLNPRARALFSNPRETLVGEKIWEDDTFYPEYRRAVEEGRTVQFEAFYPMSGAWYSVRAYPSASGLSVYLQDITERKEAEEALKVSEERFRLLAENAQDIIYRYRFSPAPGFEYVSPSATPISGYTPEEHYADPELGLKLVHPDDRHLLEAFLRSPEQADRFLTLRWIRKDGRTIWTEQKITPFYDDQGELVAVDGIGRDVTDRKRAEEALRRSEERFRSSFRDAAIGMALVGTDGRWLQVNHSLCEMLGYSEEELLGKTFQGITHPDDLAADLDHVRRMLSGEIETYQMQKRYLHADGHVVWILLSASLVHDEEGEPLFFIAQIQDITERKVAEEKIREAEERYRTLVERMPAIVYVQEPDDPSRTTYLSPQYEAILGYSPEECMTDPNHWVKITHPDDQERVLEEDRRTNETGEPFRAEYRQFTRDGRTVWLRDEAFLVRDREGTALYWLGVQLDITERRQAEERLRFQARLLDEVGEAAIAVDLHGDIEYWNKAAQEIYGWSAQEVVGQRLREIISLEDQLADEILFRLKEGKSWSGEVTVKRKDGTAFPAMVTNTPVYDERGNPVGIVGVSMDITERKQAVARLEFQSEVLSHVRDAVVAVDNEQRINYWNEGAQWLYGHRSDEVLGRVLEEVVQYRWHKAEDEPRAHESLAKTGFWHGENIHHNKDGTEIHVESTVSVLTNPDGADVGLLAVIRDITERKR